jgi:hypothetical protein
VYDEKFVSKFSRHKRPEAKKKPKGESARKSQRVRRAREPGRHEPLHTTGVRKKRFLGTQAPKREAFP